MCVCVCVALCLYNIIKNLVDRIFLYTRLICKYINLPKTMTKLTSLLLKSSAYLPT